MGPRFARPRWLAMTMERYGANKKGGLSAALLQ